MKRFKDISLIIILLLYWMPVSAQQMLQPAFGNGETLIYAVSYKVGLVNTDVAEVYMVTSLQQKDGRQVYEIDAKGVTKPFYRWFFDLNDSYISRLDAATFRPVELRVELREGSYRFSSFFQYDWNNQVVNTTWRNHKFPNENLKTMPLQDGTADALALFYNLRNIDMGTISPGTARTLNMVLEDTIRRIQYRYIGPEVRNIKGLGRFNTHKFTCQIATIEGESFADGSEFNIWISADRNKIPLYLESPIRVGTIRVRLIESSNLRYPLDSRLD